MTGPKENSEFCFPETLNVRWGKFLRLTAVPVIKSFVVLLKSKLHVEKAVKKSFTLCLLAHKFAAVSRSMTWSRVSRSSCYCCFTRELVGYMFDPWYVTHFPPPKNVFEVGVITMYSDYLMRQIWHEGSMQKWAIRGISQWSLLHVHFQSWFTFFI